MIGFSLAGVRSVVLLGAHPDDIEIAAGGLLLSLPAGVSVEYVLATGVPDRQDEARSAASAFLARASSLRFHLHDLPDGRLPAHWNAAKEIVEAAAGLGRADLVLAPSRNDAHQDHRLLGTLASTAFRDSLVLHYEIPKWDGDLSRRNVYVPLTVEQGRQKVALLHEHFPSQKARDWWDDEVFLGLARLRGMECRSHYAEAFTVDKAVLSF
ncbi:PIG-L family deacetylase [Dactylosporangium roseum]|uniref:PIG-L family deacetylase n=1 Tax=Dactylosporangium roseum TaxID=47989 RepID=A0ABY5ZBJ8_9ACTN|nr:PIG-L family deacetylase [Dactylosporangium roseum]UWZ38073.1 PIG-L family deacetylase [Dactylosporangium roseum]